LYNLVKTEKVDGKDQSFLSTFDTEDITFDINNPVDLECQPSYDGSVNIIVNDDKDVPRIINSGFSIKEDSTFERVSRNQVKKTNIYSNVKVETQLQRSSDSKLGAMEVELSDMYVGGELKGGNYVFLFKYMDDDENSSRIVAESGVVSVFKSDFTSSASVRGTLADEVTQMAVKLRLKHVDTSFSKIQVLYRRSYSDLTGTLQREYCQIITPFRIPEQDESEMEITITGIEPVINISYDDVILQYNTYKTVKTQAQVQNMLFFGNVSEYFDEEAILQNLSYQLEVIPQIGDGINISNLSGYQNPKHIYDNLGYMPGEYYRIGVVYVYNDESTSQVYNLRGCYYSNIEESNINNIIDSNSIDYNKILINEGPECYNTRGIFRMPDLEYQLSDTRGHIYPIVLKAIVNKTIISELEKLNIRGFFLVRQARIPLFLGQGLSLGVSETAHCPLLRKSAESDIYGINTPLQQSSGDDSVYLSDDHML
jgi:hypothetical protein